MQKWPVLFVLFFFALEMAREAIALKEGDPGVCITKIR